MEHLIKNSLGTVVTAMMFCFILERFYAFLHVISSY